MRQRRMNKESNNLPISLGCDVKSRMGIGMFLQMYSQMTSILYFNWAEIGTIGEPSAIVPKLIRIQVK